MPRGGLWPIGLYLGFPSNYLDSIVLNARVLPSLTPDVDYGMDCLVMDPVPRSARPLGVITGYR